MKVTLISTLLAGMVNVYFPLLLSVSFRSLPFLSVTEMVSST